MSNFDFLNTKYLGNSFINYILSLLFFILIYYILKLFKTKIIKKLKILSEKTENKIDDVIFNNLSEIKKIELLIISFYFSIRTISVVDFRILAASKILFLFALIYRVIKIIDDIISLSFETITSTAQGTEKSIKIIKNLIKTFLWIIAILFLLHNLNINIQSLLTGIGIGGVALALASQTILKDIFNFFVVLLDKPFKIGDFIILSSINISGTVEEIGLKTTKIRTLQGEVVIISNSKITEEPIQNFSKMIERRVVGKIQVEYQTPVEKLKKINTIIETIIKNHNNTRFERSHFVKFSDFSLDFEFVYYIKSPDYNEYLETNEKILFEIAENFKKENINFAYPTQTLYVFKEEK